MQIPKDEVVVLDVAGSTARVACDKPRAEQALEALGFSPERDQFVREIVDDADRQGLVLGLIRMDALFAAGRDWSPSELLDFYREQGVISQRYRTVAWTSPESYSIFQS